MGLLTEARDVTAFLNIFVGDGAGAIVEEAFIEQYRDHKNSRQKLKDKDINIYQSKALVDRAKKFGFIDIDIQNGVNVYIITEKGYELIHTFWKIHTGVAKTYFQRSAYVPIAISVLALAVAIYAALKSK